MRKILKNIKVNYNFCSGIFSFNKLQERVFPKSLYYYKNECNTIMSVSLQKANFEEIDGKLMIKNEGCLFFNFKTFLIDSQGQMQIQNQNAKIYSMKLYDLEKLLEFQANSYVNQLQIQYKSQKSEQKVLKILREKNQFQIILELKDLLQISEDQAYSIILDQEDMNYLIYHCKIYLPYILGWHAYLNKNYAYTDLKKSSNTAYEDHQF